LSSVEITVVADAEEAARLVAQRLAQQARAGGHVVLTGGSTPRRAYEIAAELEPDWSRVEVWWGDERCVPPDDEESNYALAKHSLLDRLRGAPARVHRMRGELGREQGATLYEQELGSLERFDFVLLGLGPDGHTASLFPGSPALDERERLVVATGDELHPHPRLTLTFPAIARSRLAVFTVAGEGKREALQPVKAGDELPAARVTAERVIWLVDEAANGSPG